MKLKSICINGFRSFANPQELKLADVPPGLYLVAGNNALEESLEGNGAGKSSLFEAFYWSLFGKTSRNLKAGNIRTWGAKSCCVQAELEGQVVYRQSNPNELTLNSIPIEQSALEKELHITPEVALNSFFFAQFSPFFLDLSTTARMEIYSTALQLEMWERKSDQAKDLAKTAAQGVQTLEVEHARLEEKASTLRGMDYSASIGAWEDQQKEKITRQETVLHAIDKEIGKMATKHDALVSNVAKAQRDYAKHETAVKAAREKSLSAQQAVTVTSTEVRTLNKHLSAATAESARFKKEGKGTCVECGQEIGKEHAKKHAAHLLAVEKELTEQIVSLGAQGVKAAKLQKQAEEEERALTEAAPPLKTLEAELQVLQNNLSVSNKTKYSTALAVAALKKEANPFRAQLEANKKAAKEVSEQAQKKKEELKELRTLQTRFEFWVKGFKDVRYQIMQESLVQLNAEANECLHQLGLTDWSLNFSVEKENKSGTVKRGFLCEVISPYTDEPMPWEVWSGGESQRLRLAAQMGVANLLCSRLGLEFDFEMWDEPSAWLSPGGIKDLLGVLKDRALRYGRRIFVADHRAYDFDFDGVLRITKTEDGSQLDPVEVFA